MAAELFASLSAFKTMFDMAKGLKDINNAAVRNAAVIELQEQILAAQAAQTELVEKVSELEKQVSGFEAWDAEKQRYELKDIQGGAVAYMLKPDARGTEPPHWLCPNCYAQSKKAFFQPTGQRLQRTMVYRCQGCRGNFATEDDPEWLD